MSLTIAVGPRCWNPDKSGLPHARQVGQNRSVAEARRSASDTGMSQASVQHVAGRRPIGSALRSWWYGSGVIPTTRAGTELAIVIAFLGLRVGLLIEVVPALPRGLERTTSRPLDLTLLGLALIETLAICAVVLRYRRYLSHTWPWIDVTLAVVVLTLEPDYIQLDDRVGTWTAWGGALSVNAVAGAGFGMPKRWQIAAATTLVTVVYVLVSWPTLKLGTGAIVASNVVSYYVFALVARSLAGFARRLGDNADEMRAAAAASARQAEMDRHRLLLHDQATVLRLLAEPSLDPTLDAALRQQAAAGASKIHNFLSHPHAPPHRDDTGRRLVDIVRAGSDGFSELPIEFVLDLARDVVLPAEVAGAVEQAVTTLLQNVRRHARATTIVIHADVIAADGEWELSLRDNGCGFDTTVTTQGFGLRVQVDQALAEHGVSVSVQSAPTQGTTAVLRGSLGSE